MTIDYPNALYGGRLFFEAREDQMANQPNRDVKIIDDKVAEAGERVDRIGQETGDDGFTPAALAARSEAELRKISADLKSRIEEAERENDMPLNSALGSPDFENRAADGHLDRPEDDDD
jgi:hypothetical protein